MNTQSQWRSFDHIITTRPQEIRSVFISDLHLSEESNLTSAFIALLDDLSVLPNLKELYILGDWFEVWIGDDSYLNLDKEAKASHWITPMINKLKQLRINGCHILVMVGNRDFLMRQPFCNSFAGELITEPYFIEYNQQTIRLEHGDALCTDDKDYQRFRKYSRKPLIQWWFLNKPLRKRQKMAANLRNKSQEANQKKSNEIMDVNTQAVRFAFNPELDGQLVKRHKKKNQPLPPHSDLLIHGHTHRPDQHHIGNQIRNVLGDWRISKEKSRHENVTAVIGVLCGNHHDAKNTGKLAIDCHQDFELVEFKWKQR